MANTDPFAVRGLKKVRYIFWNKLRFRLGNHTENETDISDNVAKVELDAGESLKLIQFCVKCHLIREDMGNIWGKNGK